MSRQCGVAITIQLSHESALDVLLLLLNNGWSATYGGHITYLPLGDKDDFDWQFTSATNWSDILTVLRHKQMADERLGLALFWQESGIGGTFHIEPDTTYPNGLRIWTLWNPDRPRLPDCDWFTDHGWFLHRILPILIRSDIFIAVVECGDVY